jgi:hypothetical protein
MASTGSYTGGRLLDSDATAKHHGPPWGQISKTHLRGEKAMNARWSLVGVAVVALFATVPLRPVTLALGQERASSTKEEEVNLNALQAAPAPAAGRFQLIEVRRDTPLRDVFGARLVLLDSNTGQVWKADDTNPVKPTWKSAIDAPK